MTPQMILDRMAQMIRPGFVNARMPEKMRVKVTLRDMPGGPFVTDWLPVLCPRASGDMQYDLPDVGDQVLCLFLSYGLEQGFVIGSMYGKQVPPVQNADKWHRAFRDGTTLEYDRATHQLTADIKGGATMRAEGPITLEAPIIYVRGTLVNTASDGSPGKSVFSGGMEVLDGGVSVPEGDVVAAGVSLASHTTDGVEPGSGTSAHPSGGSPESPGTAARPLPAPGTAAYDAAVAAGLVEATLAVDDLPESPRKELDELILCLPQIADAMSARALKNKNEPDAQGWAYLAGFFRLWLSTKVVLPEYGEYNEKNYGPQPLFISWEWLDHYPRVQEKLDELIRDRFKTENFKKEFTEKLQAKGCMTDKEEYFDFIPPDIADTSQWMLWEERYKQRIEVPGGASELILYGDGLVASMGNFSLRAIPRGYVTPKPEGGHRVNITAIAVYAADGFNFESDARLLFWNCEEKVFSRFNFLSGTLLENSNFRDFRKDTSYGGNFRIFSNLRLIDGLKGVYYDLP